MVGVAVNVTEVPEQIELSESLELNETEAVLFEDTVTVGEPDKLPAAAVQFASDNEVIE